MPGNKYLDRDTTTGRVTERRSADASTGIPDAGRVVALNSDGEIDQSMLPPDFGVQATLAEADEAIAAWALVEIFDDAGTVKVRNASGDAANARPAVGFVDAAYVATDIALVYFEGVTQGQAGLVAGQRIYLAASTPADGTVTVTPITSATGALHQYVGKALSATEFNFEPDDPISLTA